MWELYFKTSLRYLQSQVFTITFNHRKTFHSIVLSILQSSFPMNTILTNETNSIYSINTQWYEQKCAFCPLPPPPPKKNNHWHLPGWWIGSLFYINFIWMESFLDELSKIQSYFSKAFVLVFLAALLFLVINRNLCHSTKQYFNTSSYHQIENFLSSENIIFRISAFILFTCQDCQCFY